MCQVLLITHMLPPSCSARNGFVILLLLSYLSVAPYLLYTRFFLFLNLGAWSLVLGAWCLELGQALLKILYFHTKGIASILI